MNEETKELVKAIIEGFSLNFATKEELKTEINQLKLEVKEEMQKQTDRVLKVLEKYETTTEKHEKIFQGIKREIEQVNS